MNVAVLMGRLTDTPELRTTPSGISVTTFTIAINRAYSKQSGERQADFIDIVAWRQTAEFVCKYFKKGQMIAVNGSIQTRSYTDKEGNKRRAFEVVANNVEFTESRNPNSTGTAGAAPAADESHHTAAPAAAEKASFEQGDDSSFAVIEGDEDLPF